MKSKALLIICGPTATGKTKLALKLAKKLNGEIISADSRQVYKYMDIGTGKEGSVLGYDLVDPNEDFSVSNYREFAIKEIKNIYKKQKLPILVGGTGLYIKSIVDDLDKINIPPDNKLREELSNKTVEELYEILYQKDSIQAESLNISDKKNPRRLIRRIEILESKKEANKNTEKINFDSILWIGLSCPLEYLEKKISKRVDERIDEGFEQEISFLKEKKFWQGMPSKTLGYKDWPDTNKWKLEEFKYAKRQLTWFKKEKRIKWFNITDKNFEEKVENLAQKWYSQSNATQN